MMEHKWEWMSRIKTGPYNWRDAHELAKEKGWWDGVELPLKPPHADDHYIEKANLIVGEVCEAMECARSGHPLTFIWNRESDGKPEGFPVELADAIIRAYDLIGAYGLSPGSAYSFYPFGASLHSRLRTLMLVALNDVLSFPRTAGIVFAKLCPGIDLDIVLQTKHAFNTSRPHRHGKVF